MRSCVSVRCTDAETFDSDQCSSRFHLPFWFALAVFILAFADVQKFSAAFGVGGSAFTLTALARTILHCAPLSMEKERERLVHSVVNAPNVFKLS